MLIKEYRIVLPISVEEYQVGQLYAVAEASKNETGGGEGVEVIVNEPYEKDGEKGQYTHKIYHLHNKVPTMIRMLAPKNSLIVHEKAWNAYPYCRTVLSNEYMKEFNLTIETWHKNDMGEEENVHGQDASARASTEIVHINIADNKAIKSNDYKEEHDPSKFKSEKTGRGPLGPDWKTELANDPSCPHMCAYKLVTVKFPWRGLGGAIESKIHTVEKRLFTHFHRQVFCWMDKWIDLTMEDIRNMEEQTKEELNKMRKEGEVKGMGIGE
ncbi:phosphatidylinositol transfer protein alpha isoform-like [Takifugu rubripes]|nr:phosphatidylinositol transfer protein alpha isoform-like [Takifugu rubripes]|eukprot:XP_003968780.1 PREDICTED: phosphatidylinositol transfer protein alpha isoform-like [Takifugu rubripes]